MRERSPERRLAMAATTGSSGVAVLFRSEISSSARRIDTASMTDHTFGDREIEAWRCLLEVFGLTLESSLERAHIPGPQPTGNGEFRRGCEDTGEVHCDKCIQGVEPREEHDQRGAGSFPKTISTHIDRRLGSPLGWPQASGV